MQPNHSSYKGTSQGTSRWVHLSQIQMMKSQVQVTPQIFSVERNDEINNLENVTLKEDFESKESQEILIHIISSFRFTQQVSLFLLITIYLILHPCLPITSVLSLRRLLSSQHPQGCIMMRTQIIRINLISSLFQIL